MPHIHTEPGQHDVSTSSFIVRYDCDEPLFLLHQHKKVNALLPVGGHVELDESPWSGALHEIEEESGYTPNQLRVLQPAVRIKELDGVALHPQPVFLQTHKIRDRENHHHLDIGYAFIADGLPGKLPGIGESQQLHWLKAHEVYELGDKTHPDIIQIIRFIAEEALNTWDVIPLDEYSE